jgi:putative endopeptidase
MDEAAVEAAGIKPIKGLLDKAKKVKDAKDVGALVTELHRQRIFPLFELTDEQDHKNAARVIAKLDQSGLGLFDRDQYTRTTDKEKAIREAYVAHVTRMMGLAGYSERDAKKVADDVMAIETELAKASKTRLERRDPATMYNKIDRAGVEKAAPGFPWGAYFKALGVPELSDINVTSVTFLEAVGKLLETVKADAWQSYLTWTILRSTAGALPKKFVDESFRLYQTLTGQKDQRARWKRCVEGTTIALGELAAQPFVKKHFAGESKAAAEAMVIEISNAFAREVETLDWMDAATKARALEKLRAMAYLIGYPSKWRTYEFAIDRKSYAANVLAARAWEEKRRLSKIGKPLNREEWQMSPPEVNAYYDAQLNHMVFPAGILQPPFYDVKASPAVNLGSVGVVVGHELTHGFDDEGSQYSGSGNLEDWWSPEVSKKFKAKTGCVAAQYAAYEPLPGLHVDGRLTLGENIADLGGVKFALAALRELQKKAKVQRVADGLTEEQQFFVAHGQAWCAEYREEIERLMVQTNPHSPPRFRVIGPLSSTPAFAEAFSCAEGSPMRPKTTCAVW